MTTLSWTPLELWRASSLPTDTAKATEAYDAALRAGDVATISALRETIEDRIDALDAFYIVNMDDERAKLFKKQRLKLRKLLHKTPASVGRAEAAMEPGHHAGAGPQEGARLTLAELLVWYLDMGAKELPWLTEDAVQAIFKRHAAEAKDGRMSLAELRAAIAHHAPVAARAAPAADSGAGASAGAGARPRATAGSRIDDGGSVSSLGSGSVGTSTTGTRRRRKPKAIYAWEKQSDDEAEVEDDDGLDLDALVELKGGVTEFQVRMTAAEYAAYACKRRARQAEQRHLERSKRPRPKQLEKPEGVTLGQTGPYVEPSTLENFFYRNSKRDKWITATGFQRSPAPAKGVRPTVATVRRA